METIRTIDDLPISVNEIQKLKSIDIIIDSEEVLQNNYEKINACIKNLRELKELAQSKIRIILNIDERDLYYLGHIYCSEIYRRYPELFYYLYLDVRNGNFGTMWECVVGIIGFNEKNGHKMQVSASIEDINKMILNCQDYYRKISNNGDETKISEILNMFEYLIARTDL